MPGISNKANKGRKAHVRISLLSGTVEEVQFTWGKTGKDIRRYIFEHISDELDPLKMGLYYNDMRIKSDLKLSKLEVVPGRPIVIVQKKIPISQIQGVSSYMYAKDPFTNQQGVAKMSCKHRVGRQSIMKHIKDTIANKNYQIFCPYSKIYQCLQQWSIEECDKIVLFTKSERAEILQALARNKKAASQLKISASPPIQTSLSRTPPPTKIIIELHAINGRSKLVWTTKEATGQSLKRYIYNKLCDSLEPESMCLYYEGTKIGNKTKLSELRVVVGNHLKIVQKKAEIGQIINIVADIHGIDAISLQEGTARMMCGHSIGRDTMTVLVRSLISSHQFQIRCPYPDDNNLKCNAVWNFKDCKKIGVFTKEEVEEFEKGLSMNWIKEFSKQCPNPSCRQQICRIGLKINRVVCPSCKCDDFCYLCLKPWVGSETCGNQECKFLEGFLTTCAWNKEFNLYDKADENTLKTYLTPQYRACPNCYLIIQHKEACKHMTCKVCTEKFCWVCLGMLKNGQWTCGKFNDYCGKVAQAQKLTNSA